MLLPHAGPFFCIDLTYRPPSAPTLRTMPTPASSARSREPNILRDYGGRIHAERDRRRQVLTRMRAARRPALHTQRFYAALLPSCGIYSDALQESSELRKLGRL